MNRYRLTVDVLVDSVDGCTASAIFRNRLRESARGAEGYFAVAAIDVLKCERVLADDPLPDPNEGLAPFDPPP